MEDDEPAKRCVLVRGYPSGGDGVQLQLHFQHRTKSGGGDVKDGGVIKTREDGVWIIEFEEVQTVLRLLRGHRNQKLKAGRTEYKLQIEACPKRIYDECCKEGETAPTSEPDTGIILAVQHSETTDQDKPTNTSITVQGYPDKSDPEFLIQHFNNPFNSGTRGEVNGVKNVSGSDTWILQFDQPMAMESLHKRTSLQILKAFGSSFSIHVIQCPRWLHDSYFGEDDLQKESAVNDQAESEPMEIDAPGGPENVKEPTEHNTPNVDERFSKLQLHDRQSQDQPSQEVDIMDQGFKGLNLSPDAEASRQPLEQNTERHDTPHNEKPGTVSLSKPSKQVQTGMGGVGMKKDMNKAEVGRGRARGRGRPKLKAGTQEPTVGARSNHQRAPESGSVQERTPTISMTHRQGQSSIVEEDIEHLTLSLDGVSVMESDASMETQPSSYQSDSFTRYRSPRSDDSVSETSTLNSGFSRNPTGRSMSDYESRTISSRFTGQGQRTPGSLSTTSSIHQHQESLASRDSFSQYRSSGADETFSETSTQYSRFSEHPTELSGSDFESRTMTSRSTGQSTQPSWSSSIQTWLSDFKQSSIEIGADKVKIMGIPPSTKLETIKFYFEELHLKGSGKVIHIRREPEASEAIITYEDPKDAEEVRQRTDLCIDGSKLRVIDYIESDSHQTFGKSSSHQHQETAAKDERYRRGMEKSRNESGDSSLRTRSMHPYTNRNREKLPEVDPKKVIVSNIPKNLDNEHLELYFENKRKSNGGDINYIKYDREKGIAEITFEEASVAQQILSRRKFDFAGGTLIASKPRPPSPPPRGIEVRGFKPTTDKELLRLFFERKKSDGGPVDYIDLDPNAGVAHVIFENNEDAARVLKKKDLVIDGAKLNITPHKPRDSSSTTMTHEALFDNINYRPVNTCAIDVYGLNSNTDEEMVKLFFENRRKSGGDEVKDIFFDEEKDRYCITFENSEVVNRILQKPYMELAGARLNIQPLVGKPDTLQDLLVPMKAKTIAVEGLIKQITTDRLKLSLEKVGDGEITDVLYGLRADVAIVKYKEPPNFAKLRGHFLTKPLKGVMLHLKRVPKSTAVQIFAEGDISAEFIEIYMESAKSGGGELAKKIKKQNVGYIIEFKKRSDMQNVLLKKEHTIGQVKLLVDVFYKDLGVIPPEHDRTQPGHELPSSCSYTPHDITIISFLEIAEETRAAIDQALIKVQGHIDWEKAFQTNSGLEVKFVKSRRQQYLTPKKWKQNVLEKLDQLMQEFDVKTITTIPNAWGKILAKIHKLSPPEPDQCIYDIEETDCNIKIIGRAAFVQAFYDRISKICDNVMDEIERESKIVRQEYNKIEHCVLVLMKQMGFERDIMQGFKDVSVEIDLTQDIIIIEGVPHDILNVQLKLLEMSHTIIKKQELHLEESVVTLMQEKECQNFVEDLFRKDNLQATWKIETDRKQVLVVAMDNLALEKACMKLKEAVASSNHNIPRESEAIFRTRTWDTFKQKMENQFNGCLFMTLRQDGDSVAITATSDINGQVLEDFQGFLKEHTVKMEFLPMAHGYVRFIKHKLNHQLQNIMKNLAKYSIKINPVEKQEQVGFEIHGTVYGINPTQQKLRALSNSIMKVRFEIKKAGVYKYFADARGKEFIEVLETKHKVILELGEEWENNPLLGVGSSVTTSGDGVLTKVQHGKHSIVVAMGDIPTYKVDAIVNAANKDLKHIGGLALAILKQGGDSIQRESDRYISEHGPLLEGQVSVTSPGKLPCQMIIHAVGPTWRGGLNGEDNNLFEAISRCLEMTDTYGLRTVALPALSTGVFGYPIERAIIIIVEAIKEYFKRTNQSNIKEVHLVDNTKTKTDAFIKALGKVFPKDMNAGNRSSMQRPNKQGFNPTPQGVTPGVSSHSGSNDTVVTNEGLKLTVRMGEIAKENVDAIVNSTAQNMDLYSGAVSKSIVKLGGPQIQQEVTSNYPPGHLQPGDLIVTSGGQLNCRKIFHSFCVNWDNGKGGAEQVLRNFIQNSLKECENQGLSSVALPAIGTGQLGYPRDLVAMVMFEEMLNFSKTQPQSVQEVVMSLYKGDQPTVQAFQKEFQTLVTQGTNVAPQTKRILLKEEEMFDSGHIDTFAIGGMVGGAALQRGEQFQATIGNVLVQVQQGDITQETTDAIVNSSNKELDLSMGAVSQAILRKGGQAIQQECWDLGGTNKHDIAVTTGGRLPCKHIIHVNANSAANSGSWTRLVKKVLYETEKQKITSIAFPALGTGTKSGTPTEMASQIVQELVDFCRNKPKHVNVLRITVFQMHMVETYCEVLQKYSSAPGNKSIMSKVKGWLPFGSKEGTSVDLPPQHQGHRRVSSTQNVSPNQPVVFQIYGQDTKEIEIVKQRLQKTAEKECVQRVYENPYFQERISQLSQAQKERIKKLEQSYAVEITFDHGHRVKRIIVKGFGNDVTIVDQEINKVFLRLEEDLRQKKYEDFTAKTVRWEYLENTRFVAYPPEINCKIEGAYKNKEKFVKWKEEDGKEFTINFDKKEEIRSDTRTKVEVKRHDLLAPSTAGSIKLPSHWAPMGQNEEVKLVPIPNTSPEYATVSQKFTNGMGRGGYTGIVSIERIQTPGLYTPYEIKKKVMEKQCRKGTQVERELWHGTSETPLKDINRNGFNRSYSGINGTAYGKGVYFAVNAQYSASPQYARPNGAGIRHIYLALVLTGEYCQGNGSYVAPPSKGLADPTIRYDSVVDQPTNPSMFIIFHDIQMYPQYLIKFR